MSTSFDLTLLPLIRSDNGDQTDLEGLHIAEPPRRTARGRAEDRLVLYFGMLGNAPLSAGKQAEILNRLGTSYYKTSGSVTTAMRAVANQLNGFLLDRNVRNASSGRQAVGLLTQLVLREKQLYLAQSGPVHAFMVQQEDIRHLFDPQVSGRGLGLSRTTPIRYYLTELGSGDVLLAANQPSPTWTAGTLRGIHGQGPESLRRRLARGRDGNLNAMLVQARPGTGKINLYQLQDTTHSEPPVLGEIDLQEALTELEAKIPSSATLQGAESQAAPLGTEPTVVEGTAATGDEGAEQAGVGAKEKEARIVDAQQTSQEQKADSAPLPPLERESSQQEQTSPTSVSQPVPIREKPNNAVRAAEVAQQPEAMPTAPPEVPRGQGAEARKKRKGPKVSLRRLGDALAVIGGAFVSAAGWFLGLVRLLLRRALPEENSAGLPASTMAFIAVAVPLVVVAMASAVYVQRGRAAQYEELFSQAEAAAAQANPQMEPEMLRVVWATTLNYLKQAESYRVTSASRDLRETAQDALDGLDLIQRVNYQPAIIGGLPDTVKIIRILLIDDDLYMLDATSGHVVRATSTSGQKYELDPAFQCGPGVPNAYLGGPLIDIAPAPFGGAEGAVVMGMNSTGNVMYCFVDHEPEVLNLGVPPTAPNWGSLMGFTIDPDQGHVYVLDPLDRAVWAYWNARLEEEPVLYFDEDIPPLQDAIDIAVDKRDLYLLHTQGHITLCNYSNLSVAPTRCTDPAPYIDTRPGSVGQSMSPESPFAQMLATQPPDPSLYFLEPASQAIYHFSLRTLNFHRQFRPNQDLDGGPATAFTVNQLQRVLFLATGNNVYKASMP